MNIVDAVIIILLIVGFLSGFRKGAVKQAATLVGVVLVVVGAYYLKDPIAMFCYNNLPFINFKIFNGLSVINILFYEVIAFIIAASVLSILLRIVLKLTGLIEMIFNATVILGFVSKMIGGILGAISAYIIVFVLLFFFNQPFIKISGVSDSKYGTYILNETPYLSDAIEDTMKVIEDLYMLKDQYSSKEDFEYKSVEKFLNYKLIKVDAVKVLKEKNKLKFNGLDNLIKEYGG